MPTQPIIEAVTKVSPELLELDARNPRLVGFFHLGSEPSEREIINALKQEADIPELLNSIAANGYLGIEPLIVVQAERPKKWRVLEGNRRLAAIKLFLDPALAEACKISLPHIPRDYFKTLASIPVFAVADEEDAKAFIGFKHVNGPHKWDALAKARYAADWYVKAAGKISIDELSQKMGDSHDTIRKMLWGIFALDQAEKEALFTPGNRHPDLKSFSFSHLYTALSRSEFRQYLGITPGTIDPAPNPIPMEKMGELAKLLEWLYGNKQDAKPPVLRKQNPDLKNLGAVIQNSAALAVLEKTLDLDRAFEQTVSADEVFRTALTSAQLSAQAALSKVKVDFGSDEAVVESAQQLSDAANSILSILRPKQDTGSPEDVFRRLVEQLGPAQKKVLLSALKISK